MYELSSESFGSRARQEEDYALKIELHNIEGLPESVISNLENQKKGIVVRLTPNDESIVGLPQEIRDHFVLFRSPETGYLVPVLNRTMCTETAYAASPELQRLYDHVGEWTGGQLKINKLPVLTSDGSVLEKGEFVS